MAFEPRSAQKIARRHSRSAIRRVWLFCLFLALPGLASTAFLVYKHHVAIGPVLLLLCCLALYLLLVSAALVEDIVRPLQTLANVVSSLREGDYSFRARGAGATDALGELAGEINALADLLQKQRVRSLEATALLARILEVMHAPLFAFDRSDLLQLVNNAGVQLLGRTHARCFGRSAAELGLAELLAASDQTIHTFGTKSTRWLLRRAAFRQDGAPHTLLLLADVSVPLQEEEQTAWKRLIRVLGHELSNSLAPIKSIAGSLLMRVEALDGDPTVLHDFRRGLSVVESRADSLHRFVQSYRQLAQLPSPQLRPVALAPLLERVVLMERRLTVQLEFGPPATLYADPDQLEQMLINLLANAADASLENGTEHVKVSWRIEGESSNGMSRDQASRRALTVALEIEDNGMGIANLDNLFVPFYTTKPSGSGVGLALAQQIARAHGGEISLLNREDASGARATVRLPIVPESVG
jgi:nitrogen fixation/metabolism regulation signal transduction histidine kinase